MEVPYGGSQNGLFKAVFERFFSVWPPEPPQASFWRRFEGSGRGGHSHHYSYPTFSHTFDRTDNVARLGRRSLGVSLRRCDPTRPAGLPPGGSSDSGEDLSEPILERRRRPVYPNLPYTRVLGPPGAHRWREASLRAFLAALKPRGPGWSKRHFPVISPTRGTPYKNTFWAPSVSPVVKRARVGTSLSFQLLDGCFGRTAPIPLAQTTWVLGLVGPVSRTGRARRADESP